MDDAEYYKKLLNSICIQLLETDGKNDLALYYKGLLLHKVGKYDDAIKYFNKLLKINAWNEEAIVAKHDTLIASGAKENVIKYESLKLKIFQSEHDAFMEKLHEEYEDSIREEDNEYEKILRQQRIDDGTDESCLNDDNHDEEYYCDNAELDTEDIYYTPEELSVMEKMETIISECDKILKENPKDTLARQNKYYALLRLENADEALILCDEMSKERPDDLNAQLNRGYMFRCLGKLSEAFTIFDEIFENNPDYPAENFFINIENLIQRDDKS